MENFIANENIINEEGFKINGIESRFNIPNKLIMSFTINANIKQRAEKLKSLTSKKIDISDKPNEIISEQLIPNNPIIKDINEPFIFKDQEDTQEGIPKVKINIIDYK